MVPRARPRGVVLLLVCMAMLVAVGSLFALSLTFGVAASRARTTERALAAAREALIAYAADRPINPAVGPGYLPCPDLDGDGWAESTCGSMDGSSGQEQRLGLLPWKTLGLPELTDGDGERLWYAVSSKYKGLLNCGISRACVDMSPAAALGTITVRDASGRVVNDGTSAAAGRAGGAVAVVIAPGAPLARLAADGSRAMQSRTCAPGDCDSDGVCVTTPPQRASRCNPANYLDRAPGPRGEDNADFADRNDAAGRALNGNGFIEGPVALAGGEVVVNDRLLAVTWRDVMPAVMRRVALEVMHCLRAYATRPENGGRYPWPAPACAPFGSAPDTGGALLGGIADTPFARTSAASGGTMLDRWWRSYARSPEHLAELPTDADACRIAIAPDDAGPTRQAAPGSPADEGRSAGNAGNAWWSAWQPYVSYALAQPYAPGGGLPDCAAGSCIGVDSATGQSLARDKQVAVIVAASCAGAPACDAALGCTRIVLAADPDGTAHALAAYP
jgi:hypothetical protein